MTKVDATSSESLASILPEDWSELAPLLDQILDTPIHARHAVLLQVCDSNPDRAAALGRLVAECERELPLLDAPALDRFDQLVDDDDVELPAVLSGRYEIGRQIARGGMARVYLACDLKHEREVAVKIIRPDLAASLGRELFLREIAIAARLRHPNIVPVYDSGDDGGILYFVMPYETGRSLRDKLREGPIAIGEIVNTLHDVARALAYAHEQGVVHRDVKPDNVMLSGGSAVVTDFGIALAVRAARAAQPDAPQSLQETRGTPAYISPEQAAGSAAADHRADIYSFGCMAYELIAGRLPFEGGSPSELIAAHSAVIPRPVGELRSGVPLELASLVGRCLQKSPAARPQSARELVESLEGISTRNSGIRRSPHRLTYAALSVATAGIAIAVYLSVRQPAPAVPSGGQVTIAVLPLRNIGGDSAQAVLTEGFTDEIATALVPTPWLRVMSRAGASNYSAQLNVDYRQTGRELGVRFMLTGSMRQADGHNVLNLNLIDAGDGSTRWAARFDRPSAELEAERDEIAQSVAAALRQFAGKNFAAVAAPPLPARHVNGDAYFLQVQAQEWLDRRGRSVELSVDYFRRAIAIDPLYAKAYSGLSLALALYPYFQNTPASAVREEVIGTARTALRLDRSLAQPHIAMGLAFQHNLQWGSAAAQFDSAIRLDSHDVEARVQYGRHLLFQGRTAEAMSQFQAARADDPASSLVLGWVAYAFYLAGKRDSARVISKQAFESNALSLSSVSLRAWILLGDGHPQEARRIELRVSPNFPPTAYVLAAAGDSAVTAAALKTSSSTRLAPWMGHTRRAFAMLGVGDTAQALSEMEQATNAGEIWPSLHPYTDPVFNGIRNNARFHNLLRRVGLPADPGVATP
jgi:serine/threonine-protein kinase